MWKSTDDGLNWTEIISGDVRVRTVHIAFDSTYLYWSQDNLNGGFYRMSKATNTVEEMIPPGMLSGLGYSCTLTPFGFVCFYNKTTGGIDPNNSYIYLVDWSFNYYTLAVLTATITNMKSHKMSPLTGNIYSYIEPIVSSRTGIFKLIQL